MHALIEQHRQAIQQLAHQRGNSLMSQRDDNVYIEHMLECISWIEEHTKRGREHFFDSRLVQECGSEGFADTGRIQSVFVNQAEGTFPVDTLERYIRIFS